MGKHKSIANVVAPYGNDWRQSENLEKIVAQLDREKVPPSKSWTRRTPPARSWEKAHLSHPDVVVKAIEYSLEMAERKN